MSVERVTQATNELTESINRLLPQLSESASALSLQQVQDLLAQKGVHLFIYQNKRDIPVDAIYQVDTIQQILGMLTLVTFEIPTGSRAWIEDVVVDTKARGQGIGAQLVQAATDWALQLGCQTVDLTSRPSRAAANRLYQRQGFQPRNTNVYRYTQTSTQPN